LSHFTQTFHTNAHHVAGLQILWRSHGIAYTFGCAGVNQITGHQGHKLAEVTDYFSDTKHHLVGVALLAHFAVDFRPDGEVLHIFNQVASHQVRPKRCKGVSTFTFYKLPATLALEG